MAVSIDITPHLACLDGSFPARVAERALCFRNLCYGNIPMRRQMNNSQFQANLSRFFWIPEIKLKTSGCLLSDQGGFCFAAPEYKTIPARVLGSGLPLQDDKMLKWQGYLETGNLLEDFLESTPEYEQSDRITGLYISPGGCLRITVAPGPHLEADTVWPTEMGQEVLIDTATIFGAFFRIGQIKVVQNAANDWNKYGLWKPRTKNGKKPPSIVETYELQRFAPFFPMTSETDHWHY